jgi:hypothetical protein
MSMDWRAANFAQAKSDYEVAKRLLRQRDLPNCHALHYLQMATEKLSKAICTPPGQQPINTHIAFIKYLRLLMKKDPYSNWEGVYKQMRFNREIDFFNHIKGLLDLAQQIQGLAPSLAGAGPNPEYPWQSGTEVIAPVNYQFSDIMIAQAPKLNKLLKLLDACFNVGL